MKIKRLGLFALLLPFSKLSSAGAAVPPVPVVQRAKDLQCDQAQTLIETQGQAHLTTNNDFIWDLYVEDRDACGTARAEQALIVTSDSPACLIGWKCETN